MLTPFRIEIPQQEQQDLAARLKRTRWPDSLEDAGWQHGADLSYMKELTAYWQTQFNWEERQREINSFSHYRMDIDGLGIHFIHERGRGSNPIPLLMIHGWPGSFWEMHRILPLLTDPEKHGGNRGDSFDVVVPSLPGYGFSDRPKRSGMNAIRMAELFAELMNRLGYSKFVVQGGDWGATISTWLGLNHPERLLQIHLNYIPGSYKPFLESSDVLSDTEKKFLASKDDWYQSEGGYSLIQATKPQTLSFGLNDSPVGLAAWIVEKYRDWSACNGNVESLFSKDELLAQVCIYWFTETIHSSVRLYKEAIQVPVHFKKNQRVEIPTAIARFPEEAPMAPREWVERGYNLVRWTEMPRGGHFAAWEQPQLLAEDLRASVRPFRA